MHEAVLAQEAVVERNRAALNMVAHKAPPQRGGARSGAGGGGGSRGGNVGVGRTRGGVRGGLAASAKRGSRALAPATTGSKLSEQPRGTTVAAVSGEKRKAADSGDGAGCDSDDSGILEGSKRQRRGRCQNANAGEGKQNAGEGSGGQEGLGEGTQEVNEDEQVSDDSEVGGRERVRSRARTRLSVVNREPRVYVRIARARCSIWVNDEYHFLDIDQYTYWSMLRAAAGCG